MIKSKIVLLSALVSCALISGCKEENKTNPAVDDFTKQHSSAFGVVQRGVRLGAVEVHASGLASL